MKVLIVIDMLKGFCRPGYPLSLPDSTVDIEKHILSRGEEILKEHGKVVFVCDSHSMTDPEIGNPYPPHCMKGTVEAEIVDELKPLAAKATVLTKNTISIFLNTQLENILKELKPVPVVVEV